MGSPPPTGLKKAVLNFRSVNSIVIPAAKTDKDNNNNTAVIHIDHTNKGILSLPMCFNLIVLIVTIKFIAPVNDDFTISDNPVNIARSTPGPGCTITEDKEDI